jgi:hypothetical protein
MSDIQSTSDFWRVHPVHPAYRVSRDGQVQHRWKKVGGTPGGKRGGSRVVLGEEWKPVNPRILPSGYHQIDIRITLPNGRRKRTVSYAHRLVLEAFVGPCPAGMEACHFPDRNPANNRLENLRWDTKTENAADADRHGTRPRGSRHGVAKLTETAASEIRRRSNGGESRCSLAIEFGVCPETVRRIAKREAWLHV